MMSESPTKGHEKGRVRKREKEVEAEPLRLQREGGSLIPTTTKREIRNSCLHAMKKNKVKNRKRLSLAPKKNTEKREETVWAMFKKRKNFAKGHL